MKRALLLSAAALLAACATAQYTGRSQLMLISTGQEKQLGVQAYQDILKKGKLSSDTEQVNLLRRVGQRLAKVADRPDFQWEFNLIEEDKTINAFCLPGGKVAFYTGILPVAQGEDGIAVVMSHEIAHALARHGGERMSQGMLAQFGGQALSVMIANKPAETQRVFAEAYGLGATVGVLLPWGRKQESEADKIGLILMAKAGYDPAQGLLFWKRMEEATKGGGKPPEFLSTHPSSQTRQKQIQEWLPEIREKYMKKGPAAPAP